MYITNIKMFQFVTRICCMNSSGVGFLIKLNRIIKGPLKRDLRSRHFELNLKITPPDSAIRLLIINKLNEPTLSYK